MLRIPSCVLFAMVFGLVSPLAAQMVDDSWEPPFDHKIDPTLAFVSNAPGFNAANWITDQYNPPRFNALHASVIPEGPHRGEVLVWDGNVSWHGLRSFQPWAIVNPYWPNPNPFAQPTTTPGNSGKRFYNGLLNLTPPGTTSNVGELFCAGQCWVADGRLFVAGGTSQYPPVSGAPFVGSRAVWQFDPMSLVPDPNQPFGIWKYMNQQELDTERWYPTVLFDGTVDQRMLVIGGLPGTTSLNTYESYRLANRNPAPAIALHEDRVPGAAQPHLFEGPPIPAGYSFPFYAFFEYPRVLLLPTPAILPGNVETAQFFLVGEPAWSTRWFHTPNAAPTYSQDWGQIPASYGTVYSIDEGTPLLYPNFGGGTSQVVRIGGALRNTGTTTIISSDWMETCGLAPGAWSNGGSAPPPSTQWRMNHARHQGNVVILPSGKLVAIGGANSQGGSPGSFNLIPEELESGTKWVDLPAHEGPRDYHSTAVLLPDGRVFVAGGEHREVDYQIFSPAHGIRPEIAVVADLNVAPPVQLTQTFASHLNYGGTWSVAWGNDLEPTVSVVKVVLMRPASLTHHDDGRQRYVELTSWPKKGADNTRLFLGPSDRWHAPPGWWMLFLVTNQGTSSNAFWVHLQ